MKILNVPRSVIGEFPIVAFCMLAVAGLTWGANPPNFIFIMADDQGYADLGCFGSGSAPTGDPWKSWDTLPIRTPNIDKMAAEGVRFTDFYTGSMLCTPSRSSILTGSHENRVGGLPIVFANDVIGLNPNEVTMADLLKRKGYRTAIVGKWHLGDHPKFLPMKQGFDSFYGIPYSHDMTLDAAYMDIDSNIVLREGWTINKMKAAPKDPSPAMDKGNVPLMRNGKVIEFPAELATLTRRYADESLKFITASVNANVPFYLYLTPSMPHRPLDASPQFKGKSLRGLYGDAVEEIDFNVGRILDSLRALGIDENTLVVYTSDNGPWLTQGVNGGTAYPLRGGKHTPWEGGQKVPAVMWWPTHIPKGTVQREMAAGIDLYPTFANLAGVPLPTGELVNGKPIVIDGTDILDLMEGKPGATRGKPFFMADYAHSVRLGDWKLKDGVLYNLKENPYETGDLSASNPAKKAELAALLKAYTPTNRGRGTLTTPEPVEGCTNPESPNFSAAAKRDNGTCEPTSLVKPVTRVVSFAHVRSLGEDVSIQLPQALAVEIFDAAGILVARRSKARIHAFILNELAPGLHFLKVRLGSRAIVQSFTVL